MSEQKRKVGRPTSLTPAIKKKIVTCIEKGNYLDTAAAFAGVHRTTLNDWLRRGDDEEQGIYRDFSDEVHTAMAKAEIDAIEVINTVGKKVWQAKAWWLERRFAEKWGKKDKIEHTGPNGKSIEVSEEIAIKKLLNLTDDQLDGILSEIVKRFPPKDA